MHQQDRQMKETKKYYLKVLHHLLHWLHTRKKWYASIVIQIFIKIMQKDFNVLIWMCNLIECSKNYVKRSRSLWQYRKDKKWYCNHNNSIMIRNYPSNLFIPILLAYGFSENSLTFSSPIWSAISKFLRLTTHAIYLKNYLLQYLKIPY